MDQITQYAPDPDNMECVYHTVWVLYNVEDPYFVATLFFTFKHKYVNLTCVCPCIVVIREE